MSRFLCTLAICLYLLQAHTQVVVDKNLVPNGNFENYRKKSSNIKDALPWKSISSVDFYQAPLNNDTGRCKGAYNGDCYAGFRFQNKYKEFLEVRLAEPLKRGYNYQLEFYLRLGFWSNAALKSFGAYISKGGLRAVNFPEKEFRIDTLAKKDGLGRDYCWFKVSYTYRASGGEKYITLGNFAPSVKADMVKTGVTTGFKEAYYFIDDISLKWIKPVDDMKVVYVDSLNYEKDSVLQVKPDAHAGEKITLKVSFEQGKSYLTSDSYPELNKLSQYLFRHPSMVIQINGHSDNYGSKSKNQKISEERARAVFEYLIGKGVQNKMYFKGFGSSQPVTDNSTPEGRAQNRRVEFEIIR